MEPLEFTVLTIEQISRKNKQQHKNRKNKKNYTKRKGEGERYCIASKSSEIERQKRVSVDSCVSS